MSPELDEIALNLVVGPKAAPAAAVAVAARVGERWLVEAGRAGVFSFSDRRPLPDDAVFDLASVTKPFVAATVARLVQGGVVEFGTPLGALIEEVRGTPSAGASLELLLAHRAGLDSHRTLYAPLLRGDAVSRRHALVEAASARRSGCDGELPAAGFAALYSDLGYVLIGEAIARAAGAELDALIEREVAAPLGIRVGSARSWLRKLPDFAARVVPTEHVAFRGGQLTGVVHDENAWALAGHSAAGQAGLFAPAADVARFGAALLDSLAGRDRSFLGRELSSRLVMERTGSSLRAGFDGKAQSGSLAGDRAGPRTFGHLGFTGTSLFCDPDADSAVVLLTNRVNPSREHQRIKSVRPLVHDALFALAERLRNGGA